MNRRILKKKCKRAVEILIAEEGYRRSDFFPSDGEDTVDAPVNMERQFVHREWLEPGPLKGTPLYWSKSDYYSDDGDAHLPTDVLYNIWTWRFFSPKPEDFEREVA